jgi:hypothetical protein
MDVGLHFPALLKEIMQPGHDIRGPAVLGVMPDLG